MCLMHENYVNSVFSVLLVSNKKKITVLKQLPL